MNTNQRELSLRLYLVALVLFAVFAAKVLNSSLPLRLADPRWLQRLVKSLLSNGFLPLIGLVILHLAVVLNPDSVRLLSRRNRYSRLSFAAALGFLFLIPVHLATSWANLNKINGRQDQQNVAVITQLRQAITTSTSHEQLDQRLGALPTRITGQLPAADLALPFQLRQQKMLADFARSEDQLRMASAAPAPPIPWGGLIEAFLSVVTGALALALGYGVMAWTAGS